MSESWVYGYIYMGMFVDISLKCKNVAIRKQDTEFVMKYNYDWHHKKNIFCEKKSGLLPKFKNQGCLFWLKCMIQSSLWNTKMINIIKEISFFGKIIRVAIKIKNQGCHLLAKMHDTEFIIEYKNN